MRFGPGVHFSASDVREGARESESEGESKGNGEKEKGSVRERERERRHCQGLSLLSKGQSAVLK